MDVLEMLKTKIAEERSSISANLESGFCQSYDVYRNMVGKLSAYRTIEDHIKDIEKRYIEG